MLGLRFTYYIQGFLYALLVQSLALVVFDFLLYLALPALLPNNLAVYGLSLGNVQRIIESYFPVYLLYFTSSVALYPYSKLGFELVLKSVTRGFRVMMSVGRAIRFRFISSLMCVFLSLLFAPVGIAYLLSVKYSRRERK